MLETQLEQFANKHRLRVNKDPQDDTSIVKGRTGQMYQYSHERLAVMIGPFDGSKSKIWSSTKRRASSLGMEIKLATARRMVGREFYNGRIESYTIRKGDVYVTVVCKKCGLKDHGLTVAKAGLALKNYPNTFVCQNGCTMAVETAPPKSEREMTANEYRRLVVEPEFRARTKSAAPIIDNEWRGRWSSVYTAGLRTGTEGDLPANLEGFMALPDDQRSSLEQWAAGIKAEREATGR